MEPFQAVSNGNYPTRTSIRADGLSYRARLEQAVTIATGAIAYAIQAIENGNPSVTALEMLRKDHKEMLDLLNG